MIDRKARDELADELQRVLDGTITIDEIACNSGVEQLDKGVAEIQRTIG
jgi:hypothetical protein